MELKLKDVAEILQLSEKTIYRWIKEKKIPFYRINHQYRFKAEDINQWASTRNLVISNTIKTDNGTKPVSLVTHLDAGGIHYKVSGRTKAEVLEKAAHVTPLPAYLDRKMVTEQLIERESIASTGVVGGIAFPHTAMPIMNCCEDERISLCFLHKPVDYQALDRKKVHTLFLIMSAERSRHLKLLSQLTYFCNQPEFVTLLEEQALREEILDYIGIREKEIQQA